MVEPQVILAGLATPESFGLYHYLSGGLLAVFVLYSPSGDSLGECSEFQQLSEVYLPSMMGPPLKPARPGSLARTARNWGAAGVVLAAYDISAISDVDELLRALRSAGLAAGIRTTRPPGNLKEYEFAVLDVLGRCNESLSLAGTAVSKFLEEARAGDRWIEVHVYMKEPVAELAIPEAFMTSAAGFPLHVDLLEHKGGGAVRDLYSRLRSINPFTYVHVPLYEEAVTYCPSCGSPVAYREGGVLKSLELVEGRCWRCGAPLPFRRVASKKTPDNLSRILGGAAKWFDPRAVKTL